MPYITAERKMELDFGNPPKTTGELNYECTKACIAYLHATIKGEKPTYEELDKALGAIGEAQAEVRRRLLVPLEKRKIQENGDVFPSEWTK